MACTYVPSDGAFLRSVLGYVDCQAQTIGEQGYLALAAPGSVASLLLTILVTILIASVGYRMLFGQMPTLSDAVLTLVKIGIVVALATGWQGYRILFYDVALHGPAELAASVGAPAGLPGAGGGLVTRLDGVDQQFQTLAVIAVRRPVSDQPGFGPPPLFSGFETFAIGASRVAFLVGAISALAAVRLIAGLLLALGPLFVAFLLFEGTRGLFAGWLRVLSGAALGALATTITLGVELALLEPWLADLLQRVRAEQALIDAPAQLLAMSLVFDVVLLAMIVAAARVTWGLRFSNGWLGEARDQTPRRHTEGSGMTADPQRAALLDNRSRSVTIAEAVAAAERRDAYALVMNGMPGTTSQAVTFGAAQPLASSRPIAIDAGLATRRRVGTRISATASHRDRTR